MNLDYSDELRSYKLNSTTNSPCSKHFLVKAFFRSFITQLTENVSCSGATDGQLQRFDGQVSSYMIGGITLLVLQ